MSILRKPLSAVTVNDLAELWDDAVRETSELEFKETLPARREKGQSEQADRWITQGDRIGEYARDKILAELIAFANAEGGTLIIGVEETDDEPRRAKSLIPVPKCVDLAKRLADACEDSVEPRLPIIESVGMPTSADETDGFVLLRVGKSAIGPHRLRSDGQFYVRRGERSVKMDVREIRDSVLATARRADVVDLYFQSRRAADVDTLQQELKRGGAVDDHALLIRVSAFPSVEIDIGNIVSRRNDLWWSGGEHNAAVDHTSLRIGYPAREFQNAPRPALRALQLIEQHEDGGRFWRSLSSQAAVEAGLISVRSSSDSQGRGSGRAVLYLPWVVSLICGVLAQIQHLRTRLALGNAEFGVQLAIEATTPQVVAWQDAIYGSTRQAQFQGVEFPILSVGTAENFDGIVSDTVRDIFNHCGMDASNVIKIDWPRLLGRG
jgi:hypothetical protein